MNKILFGDCREKLAEFKAMGLIAQTCVTSPPYYGLRDYGHEGQIGLEETPEQFIANLVDVFRSVRDVLADDGTLWVNIGDSYNGSGKGAMADGSVVAGGKQATNKGTTIGTFKKTDVQGLKPKDLIGIPWMLAFALRADGWYLRQDIIWRKPNPMPESVTDRCTKSHEYIFLLSKSQKYYFDSEAIKEPSVTQENRPSGIVRNRIYEYDSKENELRSKRDSFKREGSKRADAIPNQCVGTHRPERNESEYETDFRNKRSVWDVATKPYSGAHFAVYPEELIIPCVLAGSREGDVVLDPFMGSATTAAVAIKNGRNYAGTELNEAYKPLQDERIKDAVMHRKHQNLDLFCA